nr:aldose epimerase family protein [Frigidibacter sp. ROC022]
MSDGRTVEEITLSDGSLTARVLTLGAILRDVRLAGVAFPLTLGSEDLAAYEGPMAYHGAIVGPVANRIAGAALPGGARLVANQGPNTLHGGPKGMHGRLWSVTDRGRDFVTLRLDLPDGVEGWPGPQSHEATYRIAGPGALELVLCSRTDSPCPVGPAQHGYWRLGPGPDLTGHRLTIPAERWTEVDRALIPTGACPRVEGSVHDFRRGRVIGPEAGTRYDHNYCLADSRRPRAFAARLEGPVGLTMTLSTTEPGLQVYDAAGADTAPFAGLDGQPYGPFAGLALEPQFWPDFPHQPEFPQNVLTPGAVSRQETRWSFSR